MRPALHPEMGQVVLCARVARQLANFARYVDEPIPLHPAWLPARAARNLPLDGFGMLRLALHSLAVYISMEYSSTQWLAQVLEAAHYGHSFRRCFFFEYKENRSPYPRVTNRGVQTSIEGPTTLKRKTARNA
jgi:hypothetical protein